MGPESPLRSIYVHVPFCRDRCTYCGFATVSDDPEAHAPLVEGILLEAKRHAGLLDRVETLYLGGGTPAILPPSLLERLFFGLSDLFSLSPEAEITLEANPLNISLEALSSWEKLGINRISLGIQTFSDSTLSRFGRHHSGEEAKQSLRILSRGWGGAWSADLLVGWAGQDTRSLTTDLEGLLAFLPPHLSIYGLTVEPKTPLQAMVSTGTQALVDPAAAANLDGHWSAILAKAGYERYEVSNFSLPGQRSQHNQVYWRNGSYLGLGPSAASSVHPLRWANTTNLPAYLARTKSGNSLRGSCEKIAPLERLLETLATGLRTADGVNESQVDKRFGRDWRKITAPSIKPLLEMNTLEQHDGWLRIKACQITLADRIMADITKNMLTSQPMQGVSRETPHATAEKPLARA